MNETVTPFELDDPEFGALVSNFIKRIRPFGWKRQIHHPIYRIDKWANECGVGRNDLCVCGSGKKFKKCCIDT